jgi:serine O-acetyltransferase
MNNDFIDLLLKQSQKPVYGISDKKSAEDFLDALFHFLFHQDGKQYRSAEDIELALEKLQNTFSAVVFDILPDATRVQHTAQQLFDELPDIFIALLKDAQAILDYDPAAESLDEVLAAYPGFYAIYVYRIAHQLQAQGLPLLPRLLTEYAHSKTGIDIHPGAVIGASFFIDHGTGVVIGETAVIGDHVKIYQGVTLGALTVNKLGARKKRHPTIGDNVIIYSGATILGGDTAIGRDSVIGGNVWLTQSVEPFSVVYHKSNVVVRGKEPLPEPINFVI